MSETKVRLSFEVPGATMLSSQECEENPKESYNHTVMTVDSPSKGKVKKETLHILTRKNKPAKQSISINKEAYLYMISKDSCPNVPSLRISPKTWATFDEKKRLRIHMELIAKNFGGKNPTYEILID